MPRRAGSSPVYVYRLFLQVVPATAAAVAAILARAVPPDVIEDVENLSWRGATARVHLGLRSEIRLDCPFDDTSKVPADHY